jgi:hypothetical protein
MTSDSSAFTPAYSVPTELHLVVNKKVKKEGGKLPPEYSNGLYKRRAVKSVNCYVACSYNGLYLIFITK